MAAVWSVSICGETVRYELVCLFCPKVDPSDGVSPGRTSIRPCSLNDEQGWILLLPLLCWTMFVLYRPFSPNDKQGWILLLPLLCWTMFRTISNSLPGRFENHTGWVGLLFTHNYCGRQEEPTILTPRFLLRIASHVCSQHSLGLLLRVNGMHVTQFDRARLDLLSLVKI